MPSGLVRFVIGPLNPLSVQPSNDSSGRKTMCGLLNAIPVPNGHWSNASKIQVLPGTHVTEKPALLTWGF
jgi:hypothetical protein